MNRRPHRLTWLVPVLLGVLPAAEPRRLYLSNDDHTDYMWLADEATYDRVFQEQIDFNLRLTERTKENPRPSQHRFNLDRTYGLWAYEKKRSPAEFARVVAALKSGHLSAPLNGLVSCGLASLGAGSGALLALDPCPAPRGSGPPRSAVTRGAFTWSRRICMAPTPSASTPPIC